MIAAGALAAAERVTSALGGLGLVVHPPPVPTIPVAAPVVLVQTPELVEQQPTAPGCGALYEWRVQLLIVGPDAPGTDLLDLVDAALVELHTAGLLLVELRAATYDPPDVPAPLPAALLTVE